MVRYLILIMFLTGCIRLDAKAYDIVISDSTSFESAGKVSEMPEVIVESRKYPLLHLLANKLERFLTFCNKFR